jgi:Gram-negative bacterial TonB protein C-terminal
MGTRLLRIALAASISTFVWLAAGQVAQPIISPERAAELQAQLARDPGNQRLHAELLSAYNALSHPHDSVAGAKYNAQLVWFVTNHPESPVLDRDYILFGVSNADGPSYQELERVWLDQLAQFPESAPVLFHAGLFFRGFESERSLDLFKKASRLEPENRRYRNQVIGTYAMAEQFPGVPSTDGKTRLYGNLSFEVTESLRRELATSTDPELLSGVGFRLARLAIIPGFDNNALIIRGQQLMERAAAIDPGNPRWSKAIEEARMPPPPPPPGYAAEGAVYEYADWMEKRLIKKVDPVYPPEAKEAHVQGSVVFILHVDKDGSVRKADLLWGEPPLVSAAREAVLQYRYKPYIENRVPDIENGTPTPVLGEVKVTFTLPVDPKLDPK